MKARGFCPFHLPMYVKGLEVYLTYNRQLGNVYWINWFIYLYLLDPYVLPVYVCISALHTSFYQFFGSHTEIPTLLDLHLQ